MKNTKRGLKQLKHVTLAEGEVTGHSHRAVGGVLCEEEGTGNLVLDRNGGATIQHEEHQHFALPAAPEFNDLFDVRKVQEFDHAAEAARSVVD